jgi:hypothetical protein
MKKYSEIKTLEELEQAQRNLRLEMDSKGDMVRSSFYGLKESYAPSNLFSNGMSLLSTISTIIPMDKLILLGVKALRNKIMRK